MDSRAILAYEIMKAARKDGLNETSIAGVRCLKFSEPSEKRKGEWPRSFLIVAQGSKEIQLEDNVYRYDGAHYIATPIALQVTSRVKTATKEIPYLGLLISFDPRELAEVARQMNFSAIEKTKMRSHGLFSGKASDEMLESAIRLVRLISSPNDAKVLAPLFLREIYFHLLKSSNGVAIHQFIKSGSKTQKIAQAIQILKSDLSQDIDVQDLAEQMNMSRTSFFRSFNEIIAMSPIQYQKRLRLVEARRLLIDENESAEGAAFKVGYKSASQFSREYSRMFGRSPIKDVQRCLKQQNQS